MAVPKVLYLIDYLHAELPLIHDDYNERCVFGESVGDHVAGQGLCGKQIKGGIFWTCNEVSLCCGHFFCKKHLDMEIRDVFKNGKVTVTQPDGEDIEKEIEQLLAERKEK